MKVKTTIRHIEARMAAIAKERDRLDHMMSEIEGLKDACARAHDALEEARDCLSELV